MKIFFVASLYYPNIGGVETTITELSNFYIKQGHEVAVLTKKYPTHLSSYEKFGGIEIFRVISPHKQKEFLEVSKDICKRLGNFNADIVHLIGVRRHLTIYAMFLSKIWKCPFLITFSGGDVVNVGDKESEKIWNEGLTTVPESVYQADAYTTFSNSTKELTQLTLPKIKDIDVIYAGLNLNKFKQIVKLKADRPYILSARRLFFSKGVDLLINAFYLIKDKFPNLDLYIAGDGPEYNNLVVLTQKLGLEKRVIFLGSVSYDKYLSLLKGSKVHVCPSRSEGGGIVNYEAQAAGTIALGSNAGGIPEYIQNGKTGYLFQSEDINDLAEKLEYLLINRFVYKNLIKSAKQYIKIHDWSNVAKVYLKYYNNLQDRHLNKEVHLWSVLSKKIWRSLNNG